MSGAERLAGGRDRAGAVAGGLTVVFFAMGAALLGGRPAFADGGAALVPYLAEHRREVQVACALFAVAGTALLWTLAALGRATATSSGRRLEDAARACATTFVALFLVDVSALAVLALRPVDDPGLATALQDLEMLLMAIAAVPVAGFLVAHGMMLHRRPDPVARWLGRAAIAAAAAYLLRLATLIDPDGALAPDGVLGLVVPVGALLLWVLAASWWLWRPARDGHAVA